MPPKRRPKSDSAACVTPPATRETLPQLLAPDKRRADDSTIVRASRDLPARPNFDDCPGGAFVWRRVFESLVDESDRVSFVTTCRKLNTVSTWHRVHPSVTRTLAVACAGQREPGWYQARHGMATCSDCQAAITGCKNKGRHQFFREKTFQVPGRRESSGGGAAANHGVVNEDRALDLYSARTGERVFNTGLVQHQTISFFGGSPDGITASGRLLEIKCPYSDPIVDAISVEKGYYAQVQGLMEVLDLEECDFVQYQPPIGQDHADDHTNVLSGVAQREIYSHVVIPRDRDWFQRSLPAIAEIWQRVLEFRRVYLPLWRSHRLAAGALCFVYQRMARCHSAGERVPARLRVQRVFFSALFAIVDRRMHEWSSQDRFDFRRRKTPVAPYQTPTERGLARAAKRAATCDADSNADADADAFTTTAGGDVVNPAVDYVLPLPPHLVRHCRRTLVPRATTLSCT